MSKELSAGINSARSSSLPASAHVAARLGDAANHYEDVLFKCSFNREGRLTRALDTNSARANTFVEIIAALPLEQPKGNLVERIMPGIYRHETGSFTFCVKVITTNDARPDQVCDLEGFVINEEGGTFLPCANMPKPVLNEIERVFASDENKASGN